MVPDCSIIIPAYNAEATVSAALNSIELNGDWTSRIEVVVVDDGSRDGTLAKLSEYAASNESVIVIRQNNAGVSSARNAGIAKATGRYLFFMDADDTVCRKTLEYMIKLADEKSLPLVVANYYEYRPDTKQSVIKECRIPTDTVLDQSYIIHHIFLRFYTGDKVGLSNLWNKLFSREYILKNGLRFDEQMSHGEDWFFCMRYFETITSFIAVSEKVYYYRISGVFDRSKYGRPKIQEFINSYRIQQRLREKYQFCQKDSEEHIIYLGRCANLIVTFLSHHDISAKEKRAFLRYDEVKSVMDSICSLNSDQLAQIQQSGRYQLAFRMIRAGLIKTGIAMIK